MSIGFFNPFVSNNNITYTIKREIDFKGNIFYQLVELNNGVESPTGEKIIFTIENLKFDDSNNLKQILNSLIVEDEKINNALQVIRDQIFNSTMNIIDFDDLGIDTTGKTLEQIVNELNEKNISDNTIVKGLFFEQALPTETEFPLENAGAQVTVINGANGEKYYQFSAVSDKSTPYRWEAIYKDNELVMDWTPAYDSISDNFKELKQQFLDHINDSNIHVTTEEKNSWNEKISVSVDDSTGNLIFYNNMIQ